MNPDASRADSPARLKIGAVARLTGLSVHTLRKWEERYAAVTPARTGSGGRLYSHDDVRRLALIKRLTQAGLPLAEVAGRSLAELQNMVDTLPVHQDSVADGAPLSTRVAVVGAALCAALARNPGEAGTAGYMAVLAAADSSDGLGAALAGQRVDCLLFECPTVHAGSATQVHDAMQLCGASSAVVVYRFGADAALAALRQHGFAVLRAPADLDELELAVLRLASRPLPPAPPPADLAVEPAPPARFSMAAIRRAATSAPAMRCECPHHLADLLFSLRAFERYSQECESTSPEDAALHRYLAHTAGRARSAFEEALARVAAAEGMTLEEDGGD